MKPLRTALTLSLLALAATGLNSCLSAPDYDVAPSIDFDSITAQRFNNRNGVYDSVAIAINFRDGDGDLGLGSPPTDTEPPFSKLLANGLPNRFYDNYFIGVQVRRGTAAFKDTIIGFGYNGRYLRLSTLDKPEPLKGRLVYSLNFFQDVFPNHTDVRFKISIADRALHESNVITTDPIRLSY